MIEFEKKILLTEDEYGQLLTLGIFAEKPVKQKNYYFDTDNFDLNELNITCRIRKQNGRYKATFKAHQPDFAHCSIENSVDVKSRRDRSFFKNMNVRFQGSLTTYRREFSPCVGVTAFLDKNIYLGNPDYELEIEYSVKHERQADEFLGKIADSLYISGATLCPEEFLNRVFASESKSERFFKKKTSLKRKK